MAKRDLSLSYIDGSTISGADALLQAYEIALFTLPSEFSSDPDFGIGLEQFVSEPNTEHTARALRTRIESLTRALFSEIRIEKLTVIKTQANQISVQIDLIIVPYGERRTIRKEVI